MFSTMSAPANVPVVHGSIDLAYVQSALARGGLADVVDAIEMNTLTDGRSGAVVTAIKARGPTGERALVQKTFFTTSGFRLGIGDPDCNETHLWASGATRRLP